MSHIIRIILCIGCGKQLRVPVDKLRLKITCPACRYRWVADTSSPFNCSRESSYKVVDLEQGSRRWLDWRYNGIGASDAPAIMGENPWKTRQRLLAEKRSRRDVVKNSRMNKGTTLEPEARRRYESTVGFDVSPKCIQSVNMPRLRASLDGISDNRNFVVEIKCGEKVYRAANRDGKPPQCYYGQLQHILLITNLNEIDFFCHWPGEEDIRIRVKRDDDYISVMLAREEEFFRDLSK